jgi:hypothetical protein
VLKHTLRVCFSTPFELDASGGVLKHTLQEPDP